MWDSTWRCILEGKRGHKRSMQELWLVLLLSLAQLLRTSGLSGPLQGSGTLVNPSSVCSECFVGVGGGSWPGFEWLATTSLIIKVHTHH